ncbi:hypothetical protein N7492_004657 [Penicillium capsulatum]|uniref:DUF7730 domain-containing protein n=1 Tax=Penicillium capsulatum TaxID=69766 RepID=A0A9W9I815_9EURO|nr:hypothetical protein N7492_004657 [Penicillium capsulatum]KAJ6136232.1 hypothetical protein N7512_001392 [Penicillium capsulatum]
MDSATPLQLRLPARKKPPRECPLLTALRPRILTPPPPAPNAPEGVGRSTIAQGQSLFFVVLPREVRDEIYFHALGGRTIHFFRTSPVESRLWSCSCQAPRALRHEMFYQDESLRCRGNSDTLDSHDPKYGDGNEGPQLSLLITCRRVYSEAVNILYAQNIMHVRQTALAFQTPAVLQAVILPQRIHAIQYMEIAFRRFRIFLSETRRLERAGWFREWVEMWDAITRFKGLRSLHVWVGVDPKLTQTVTPLQESLLLSPLMQIDWVPEFCVNLTWPPTGDSPCLLSKAPFTVVRDATLYDGGVY